MRFLIAIETKKMSGNGNGLPGLVTGIQLGSKNRTQTGLIRTDPAAASGHGNYGNFVDEATTYTSNQRIAGRPGVVFTAPAGPSHGDSSFRMAPTSQSSGLPLAKVPLPQ